MKSFQKRKGAKGNLVFAPRESTFTSIQQLSVAAVAYSQGRAEQAEALAI